MAAADGPNANSDIKTDDGRDQFPIHAGKKDRERAQGELERSWPYSKGVKALLQDPLPSSALIIINVHSKLQKPQKQKNGKG